MVGFQLGTSDMAVYIDSVMLLNLDDVKKLTTHTPVVAISVSGEAGVDLGEHCSWLLKMFLQNMCIKKAVSFLVKQLFYFHPKRAINLVYCLCMKSLLRQVPVIRIH